MSAKNQPAAAAPKLKDISRETLDAIANRAHYLATQMIFQANSRSEKDKGDPKIGGHMAACGSALHIMGALHLIVKSGFDHIANKPHASPVDHSYNYLLDLFLNSELTKLTQEQKDTAMMGLRKYSKNGEPVFQSYHSAYDSDHHNFFPSGTVGIPPVNAGYLALAYRYAAEHGYKVPDAHFWALTGDSEFREGSMYEAVPDFADREIGNLTWIVDYNRQSLDGHRIINEKQMRGTDADRIERTMSANGWEVIQLRHGSKRQTLFKKPGGEAFKNFLENELKDYELQALLLVQDMKALKKGIIKEHGNMKKFIENVSDQELFDAFRDFGGHDILMVAEAMLKSKQSVKRPTIIIAHTLKGWGLKMAAAPGNHSALLSAEEMDELKAKQGIKGSTLFAGFETKTNEAQYLKTRGEKLYSEIKSQHALKNENETFFANELEKMGAIPEQLDINTKMASYPHTQWMLGQLTAKLTRIANADSSKLTDTEKKWKTAGELFMTMAPDVGTSTNLNPAMDGKIFGAPVIQDLETDLGVKDTKLPDLVPGEEVSDRFLRFEIAEGNVMSCVGSFGKMREIIGVPIMPLMTIYDFFIKRALDQYFYNLYWKSSFICVGTPSGVTLSPEGAQHGWKSDFQIPNQITWEPFFCIEVDWILSDAFKRHLKNDNVGRQGTLLRLVTRGIEQKDLMKFLTKQSRYKQDSSVRLCRAEFPIQNAAVESELPSKTDSEILTQMRTEVLKGAYHLIDYKNYAGYEPGDNVVNIFAMGSMVTEAIKASENLLARGIYANVIVVTSPDLVCGILAHENNYDYLKNELHINSDLFLNKSGDVGSADLVTVSGRRIPIVSVHDGEAGLLDNLGSIVGVRHESCSVRKHSKCGRPSEIYHFHQIDDEAVVEACGKVLSETALEKVIVAKKSLDEISQSEMAGQQGAVAHWTELWPTKNQSHKH